MIRLLLCFVFSAGVAHSQLVLLVNSVTKEFALSGSDTGTPPTPSASGGTIVWTTSYEPGVVGNGLISYDNDVAFSTNVGTPGNNAINRDIVINANTFNGNIARIELQLGVSVNTELMITGSSVYQSYAGFNPDALAVFESKIGDTLTVNGDFGWQAINIVGSTVPEPAAYPAILGLLAVGFAGMRRRRSLYGLTGHPQDLR